MKALYIIFFMVMFAPTTLAKTDRQLLEQMINHKLNNDNSGVGISAAIIEDGKVEYLNFGLVNKADKVKTTESHLFEIGSISKTFTTLALSSMVREGKIKLDDTVQKYLPDSVKMPTFDGKAITLKHLANHTSALPRLPTNMKMADPSDPYADYTIDQLYEFLNSYKLTRTIGEKAEYSNLGMGLLGHVLALIDNKTYEQVVTARVLKPFGMADTYVDVPQFLNNRVSDGHNGQLQPTKPWQLPTLAGAGALKSTASDMVRFLQANMKQAPQDFVKLTHTPTAELDSANKIGLGWLTNSKGDSSYTWHNGGTGGFRSFAGFDSKSQKAIVLLGNSIYPVDDLGHAYLAGRLKNLLENYQSDLTLLPEQMDKLVGDYPLFPNFVLSVSHDGNRLYIKATGQDKFPVFAKSATHFYYKVVKAEVFFEVDENGEAVSLTLHQGGQELKGNRVK